MRYFLEVSYKGTNYAGFQVQQNANTIQAEVEKALNIFFQSSPSHEAIRLTGSSRTDTGVHAKQNYFHFDHPEQIPAKALYNFNALLPHDIVINSLTKVHDDAHCRFDAISREYKYFLSKRRDPFTNDTAWFYPYKLDMNVLQEAASAIMKHHDFTSFSKKKSQAKTNHCTILQSEWRVEEKRLVYHVKANRFLRGMVKGLVGTMLLVGRKKISLSDFENIIVAKDCSKANFAAPSKGLFLVAVAYPASVLNPHAASENPHTHK